jgi:hypothetical protein
MVQADLGMCRVLGLEHDRGIYAEKRDNHSGISKAEIGVDYDARDIGYRDRCRSRAKPPSSCEYKRNEEHLGRNFT